MRELLTKGFNIKSPLQKALLIIGTGVLINIALIYFFIMPLKSNMSESKAKTSAIMHDNNRIRAVIKTTDDSKDKVAELHKEYSRLSSRGILTPLLNSYAMRAKTLLQPFSARSGLIIENIREMQPIPLQQPEPLKEQTHWRQPIEVAAFGSYTQLVSFISIVESELPLAILSSMKVSTQQREPERHKIQISFEWPIKTELSP